jgi:hypothetical protein
MRLPLPWTWISGPGCSLSRAISAPTSPRSRMEFCHSTARSVVDATYFVALFNALAAGSSAWCAVPPRASRSSSLTRGQCAAKIS